MKYLAIIPARYASTRFPGKPLAMLGGKPVIRHVYEKVSSVLEDVYVATDNEEIHQTVEAFGGRAVMTSDRHKSGTDRCREAYERINGLCQKEGREPFDVVINIQGDEPFIAPAQIRSLMDCFSEPETEIATLIKPFTPTDGIEALRNPNSPKVVTDAHGRAMYFSRSVIPYLRGVEEREWLEKSAFYKHIGIYAYRAEALLKISAMPQSALELAESLEQLRWLENGLRIQTAVTSIETIGIDTPEDLGRAEEFLNTCICK